MTPERTYWVKMKCLDSETIDNISKSGVSLVLKLSTTKVLNLPLPGEKLHHRIRYIIRKIWVRFIPVQRSKGMRKILSWTPRHTKHTSATTFKTPNFQVQATGTLFLNLLQSSAPSSSLLIPGTLKGRLT